MSTSDQELRELADKIGQLAREHPSFPTAQPIIDNCVDHLRATARVHELHRTLPKDRNELTMDEKKDLLNVLDNCTCEFVGDVDGLPMGYFEDDWNGYLAELVKADMAKEKG